MKPTPPVTSEHFILNTEALALADGDFDAAILDVSLGADTSFALADRLMARGVPFAFATGYVADDGELGRGAVARLPKPFEFAAFRAVVGALLGGAAALARRTGR